MEKLQYNNFRYLYPPRPENALPRKLIPGYEKRKMFLAQPKLNGDCLLVFMNGKQTIFMDRHKTIYTKIPAGVAENIASLYKETLTDGSPSNKWMVLVGEFMAKSQKDADNKVFNHKFIIHDIIVFDGVQLVGKTTQERVDLLDTLYGKDEMVLTENGVKHLDYLYNAGQPNCFRVKSYYECLDRLWDDITKIGMYEGLVFKMINAKLENGVTEKNNSSSMLKFRKPTKNYSH